MQFTKMAQIQISDSVAVTYLGYTSLLSSIGQQKQLLSLRILQKKFLL